MKPKDFEKLQERIESQGIGETYLDEASQVLLQFFTLLIEEDLRQRRSSND
ncbi:MAG: hypothetical protein NC390_00510 [Fusobacterium sp.]|nr:hypothetical protein [Fusobacterium sp.]